MIKHICDRCGRLMEGADRANVSYFYGGNGTADLCKGCNEEFLRWMKTERVMEFFNPELYNSAPDVLVFRFHKEEAFRIAKFTLGLSTISAIYFKGNKNKIWWWRTESNEDMLSNNEV